MAQENQESKVLTTEEETQADETPSEASSTTEKEDGEEHTSQKMTGDTNQEGGNQGECPQLTQDTNPITQTIEGEFTPILSMTQKKRLRRKNNRAIMLGLQNTIQDSANEYANMECKRSQQDQKTEWRE